MILFFSVEEALAVVVGAVVVGAAVVTSVVGAAAGSAVFFSPFPQAATIKADRSVTEVNKILFFKLFFSLIRLIPGFYIIVQEFLHLSPKIVQKLVLTI